MKNITTRLAASLAIFALLIGSVAPAVFAVDELETPVVELPELPEDPEVKTLEVGTVTVSTPVVQTTEVHEISFATSCDLSASAERVDAGASVTLDWSTEGFDTFILNGKTITDANGSIITDPITQDTTYTFVAKTADGNSECTASVTVVATQVSTQAFRCEDFGFDYEVAKFEANGNSLERDFVMTGYDISVAGSVSAVSWTASPAVAGVIGKAATNAETFSGGTNGSINQSQIGTGQNAISHISFCANKSDEYIPDCSVGGTDYNPEADLVGNLDESRAAGTVINSSEYCSYDIGLASYKKFDNEIDNQVIFDSVTDVIEPNSQKTLRVSVPTCSYQIDLFYGPVIQSFNPEYYRDRLLAADHIYGTGFCEKVEEKKAKIVAEKIICTNEAELPNWGNGGPDITVNTARDWVDNNASCSFAAGWEFQWTNNQSADPGDTLIGRAGSPWNTFGPTDATGKTSAVIDLNTFTGSIWVREVLKENFIPFTHGLNGMTNVDNVSAEMYCHTDVLNYDNRDFVANPEADQMYHCVAWNVPVVDDPLPSCDLFTATPNIITVGSTSTLEWSTTNATRVVIDNGIGEVAATGTLLVSPLADTIYSLTVFGADNTSAGCEVPVNVSQDEVPVCELFTATPSILPESGGTVSLAWETTGAEMVSISPTVGAVAATGTTDLFVDTNTNFVLTAIDNNGDEVSCEAPVTLESDEVFTCADNVTFTASDTSIRRGNQITLTWNTTGVDTVSISGINATALSGSEVVKPNADTTYVLTATNGNRSVECPLPINVTTGGGGGGSSSPRCELEISDTLIRVGEEIELTWDTRFASEVTITDDLGNTVFTTDDMLSDEKRDFYDGSITLRPTRDTEYILVAERGSRDRECRVEVETEDEIVVLQTRDQQPLVAGISLSEVPYTGFEAGPFLTTTFYVLLAGWAFYISYLLVMRNRTVEPVTNEFVPTNKDIMDKAVERNPEVFAQIQTPNAPTTSPSNLPTGTPTIGYQSTEEMIEESDSNIVSDAEVTTLENVAHAKNALLSSDAIRHFVATTKDSDNRVELLNEVIAAAKEAYPLEDGWIVLNEARMHNMCLECRLNELNDKKADFRPTVVPDGSGSLAEAIVTGNVVAAYEMIGNRPMFALADAAADLDSVYRNRRGASEVVSDLLVKETDNLSDEQIKAMIKALTSALDGTYTDEASAVKMAIMKAVKEVS